MSGWGQELARVLIWGGVLLILLGLLLWGLDKISFPLGKLPGDIVVRRGNFTFYFPWVTCLLLSVVLSLLLFIFRK
ncbi:MAG: Uncharacterized protein XD41_0956 [Desulfonauticus sp. 38_4375]|jgi:hypothetical protein|nr:MAG: Uncharacterized protein XD41_0956 [Desulfonauticus sp. 38_4375]